MTTMTWDEAVESIYARRWGSRPVHPGSKAHADRLNVVMGDLLDRRYFEPKVIDGGRMWRAFDQANNRRLAGGLVEWRVARMMAS